MYRNNTINQRAQELRLRAASSPSSRPADSNSSGFSFSRKSFWQKLLGIKPQAAPERASSECFELTLRENSLRYQRVPECPADILDYDEASLRANIADITARMRENQRDIGMMTDGFRQLMVVFAKFRDPKQGAYAFDAVDGVPFMLRAHSSFLHSEPSKHAAMHDAFIEVFDFMRTHSP